MSKITVIDHLRSLAQEAKNFANGLVSSLATATTEAIEELADVKADKPGATALTIPVSGWSSDSDTNWPKYYDIAVEGVTAADRAEITLAPGGMSTAKACGLCPTCETLTGKIRVRATSVPAAAIAAEYWIENGKE